MRRGIKTSKKSGAGSASPQKTAQSGGSSGPPCDPLPPPASFFAPDLNRHCRGMARLRTAKIANASSVALPNL